MTLSRRVTVLVLLLSLAALAAQVPSYSVKTEEVRVDVLITEHGKPVHGLKGLSVKSRPGFLIPR